MPLKTAWNNTFFAANFGDAGDAGGAAGKESGDTPKWRLATTQNFIVQADAWKAFRHQAAQVNNAT
jgi:hypothetical protein